MRILFTSHYPLTQFGSGHLASLLAEKLSAAGHEIRFLVTSDQLVPTSGRGFQVQTLLCQSDDCAAQGDSAPTLSHALPRFIQLDEHDFTFDQMSPQQLIEYREKFRQLLNAMVEEFDPHIIHGQHAWLQSELILETGVPYVLSVYRSELQNLLAGNQQLQELASVGAENAGCLLVEDQQMREMVRLRWNDLAPQITIVPALADVAQRSVRSEQAESDSRTPVRWQFFVDTAAFEDLEMLLNAASRLSDYPYSPTIQLIGQEPRVRFWKLQAQRRGLQNLEFFETNQQELELASRPGLGIMASNLVPEVTQSIVLTALAQRKRVILLESSAEPAWLPDGSLPVERIKADHEQLAQTLLDTSAQAHRSSQPSLWHHGLEHRNTQAVAAVEAAYQQIWQQRFGKLPTD